jgi:hypothetical protein
MILESALPENNNASSNENFIAVIADLWPFKEVLKLLLSLKSHNKMSPS